MALLTEEEVIKSILHARPGALGSSSCDKLYNEIRSRLMEVSKCLLSLRKLSNRTYRFLWAHKMIKKILTVICTLAYIKHLLKSFYSSSKKKEEGISTGSPFSEKIFGSTDKAKLVRPDAMRFQCQELEKEFWNQLEEITRDHRKKGWSRQTYDLDMCISVAIVMRRELQHEQQGAQLLRTLVQLLDAYLVSLQAEAARASYLNRCVFKIRISHAELVLDTVRSSFPPITAEISNVTVDVPPMTADDFFSLCCLDLPDHIGLFFK